MSRNSRTRLYIGRLKEGVVTPRHLEDLFLRYGRIVDIQVKGNYGFVEYDNEQSADAAAHEMNRRDFMGDRLIVEHAKKDDKKSGGGGRGRSPSPPRYGLGPGSHGRYYGGPPPAAQSYGGGGAYGSHGYDYYNQPYQPSQVGGYDSMPPYRPYDDYPPRRDIPPRDRTWSPVRSMPPRRRSRSRSPIRNRPPMKRRSSPLRVKRRKSPLKNKGPQSCERTTKRSSWRICVENLTPDTTWQDLRKHFLEIGEIFYASVASDGSGFVEFSDKNLVTKAIEKLNNTLLQGNRIQVVNSIPPEEDTESLGGEGDADTNLMIQHFDDENTSVKDRNGNENDELSETPDNDQVTSHNNGAETDIDTNAHLEAVPVE